MSQLTPLVPQLGPNRAPSEPALWRIHRTADGLDGPLPERRPDPPRTPTDNETARP
jgi:hypothetical protein